MRIGQWAAHFASLPPFGEALAGVGSCEWTSVVPEARPVLVARAWLAQPRMTLVVVSSHERALTWQAKLVLCGVPESSMRELPSGISTLFEDVAPEAVALSDRIGALRALLAPEPTILFTTPTAALERTLPRELLSTCFRTLRAGETLDLHEFQEGLTRLGYEPADPVRGPGQFSRRGGLIDVFAVGYEQPVRIELFGDAVESIRRFDPNSQRSVDKVESVEFAPSREVLYPSDVDLPAFLEMVQATLTRESAILAGEAAARLSDLVHADMEALSRRVFFDRLELYRPLIHPESECAVDLLPDDGWLILEEPSELEAFAARSEDDLRESLAARSSRGEILSASALDYMQGVEILGGHGNTLSMTSLGSRPQWVRPQAEVDLNVMSTEPYRGQAAQLVQVLNSWREAGFHIAVATDQPSRARAMLEQVELFAAEPQGNGLEPGTFLVHGNLAGGFLAPDQKVALLTDQELFGVARLKLPQRKFNEGEPITTVLDLRDGDYVVHINYGIGIFRGLVRRSVGGVEKEFLYVEYAAPDKLFVPADQLDRIQKYLNPGEVAPKLNRLVGGEWTKTVRKAREEAREFARDLTRLYAQRKAAERRPFGPDSPWQAEMEATFPYVETRTQLRAILDVKADLNNDFPMDRLVCGDVGFGKTEVAIRAAFKVAQAGRQVAVLCPTTILSEQHFRNFQERLAAFPMRVALLNRFCTTGERRVTLAQLQEGEVDLVLGTHALLGREVRFKDLGLVVIDEEQKFGVKQKEVLKELRLNVDVLTLSATPIPRTLSMALMDVRQMSLITDPPAGRLPIRTFVREYSREVVREAILRELARGGQVFYVYNRVQGIFHVAEQLRKLVPHARVVVGHGQMHEKELEPVMVGFIKGEADILLSTTIVESGLDIPNANTLIVENSDRMGLAQLYQLRGRVGRSDRQAYAYLLHEGNKSLTEGATSRLQALQEFSALGSGYSLAFRDLQIRGAGDLLGAKQSGTMATVGYDLFVQLIAEEVRFLKSHADGESRPEYRDPLEGLEPLPSLDLPTKALIPDTYIEDQAQRLYYYQRLMSRRDGSDLTEVEGEIADRYGKLPDEVKRAIWIMRLRLRAHHLGIEKIDGQGGRLAVTWYASADLNPRIWVVLQKEYPGCYFARGQFTWPYTGGPLAACEKMLATVEQTVQEIEGALAELR